MMPVVPPMISVSTVPLTINNDHLAGLSPAVLPMAPITVTLDNDYLRFAVVAVMPVMAMVVIIPDHDHFSPASVVVSIPAICVGSRTKGDKPD